MPLPSVKTRVIGGLLMVFLAGCSGWVEHQQIAVTSTPAGFNAIRTFQSIGYRLVDTAIDTQPPPSIVTTYRRAHSPRLTANIFRDGSLNILVWDSGVPPFAWPTGLSEPVGEIITALRGDGVKPEAIRTSATYSPPGRIRR